MITRTQFTHHYWLALPCPNLHYLTCFLGVALSPLGQKYLEEIRKYKAMGMDIRGVEDIKADQKQS